MITNKFQIFSNLDISVVIKYIDEYNCLVISTPLDNIEFKPYDLKILFDTECSTYYIEKDEFKITTKHKLYPKINNYFQKIPKIIVQTTEYPNQFDDLYYNIQQSLLNLNPEYQYFYFDKFQRKSFLIENINLLPPNIILAYDLLIPGAFQADLFRYCFIYINGGCYLDHKMIMRKPFRDIINYNDEFLVCIDYEKTNTLDKKYPVTSYLNSIIISVPNNKLIYKTIEMCIDNILKKQSIFLDSYGDKLILDVTGPTLFYKAIHSPNLNLKFKHIIDGDVNNYNSYKIIDLDNLELIANKTYKTHNDENHYSKLWFDKKIFFKESNNSNILIFPHPNTFNFFIDDNQLIIVRTDKREGWGLDLYIKTLHNQNVIHIGKSDDYIKKKSITCISLGTNCCVALSLQKLNLKRETLPFDWIPNLSKIVIDCLEDDFKKYNILGEFKIKNNFNDELYKFKLYDNSKFDINYINYYNNWFPHDTHVSIEQLKNKNIRRCDRFMKLLKNQEELIFIYTNEEVIYIKEYRDRQFEYYKDLIKIQNIILNKYNKINFKIIGFFFDLGNFNKTYKNTKYITCYPIDWDEGYSDNGEFQGMIYTNKFRDMITEKLKFLL